MKDIIGAIEKEKEYISYRMKGEEPYHWVDAVKEFGFETLGEFHMAKQEYELSLIDFKLVKTSTMLAMTEVLKAVASKEPTVILVDIDQTVVFPRNDAEYDKEYCIEHNIPILQVPSNGNGALVSLAGDLGLGICIPKPSNITVEYLLGGVIKILQKHTNKTVYNEGNDIMVDGKKVCGFAFVDTPDVFMAMSPISLVEKSDLISTICLKKRQKTPSYIDFVDRKTFKQEVLEWLQAQ